MIVSKRGCCEWNRGTICGFTKRQDCVGSVTVRFCSSLFYTIGKIFACLKNDSVLRPTNCAKTGIFNAATGRAIKGMSALWGGMFWALRAI